MRIEALIAKYGVRVDSSSDTVYNEAVAHVTQLRERWTP